MPEGDQQDTSLGWRAGLPDDLKTNESFTPYKTVGDFAKAHIETATKLRDVEGKLGNSIPKLRENATQEERNQYLTALGRPDKPESYQLEGGDKEKEQALAPWKQDFHELGLTSDQAKGLNAKWDGRISKLVEQHQAQVAQDNAAAAAGLKQEWGDKFDTNRELVSRLWKKEMDVDLDKAFEGAPQTILTPVMRFLFKIAAKTGEDNSQRAGAFRGAEKPSFINYDKSPAPPQRFTQ